jgi:hypothetical protein
MERIDRSSCRSARAMEYLDLANPCAPIDQIGLAVHRDVSSEVVREILMKRINLAKAIMSHCPFAQEGMPCFTDNQIREYTLDSI